MNVLAFDTATAATVAAFGELERRDDPPPGTRPAHAQKLLTLIEEVLAASQAGWSDVDRIAVGVGPGTFTGLRIGIASAQALAQATGIELVGVSTLASLELAARGAYDDQSPILAVIDARRNEAFVSGAGLDPRVLTPEALGEVAGSVGGGRVGIESGNGGVTVGNGLVAVGDGLVAVGDGLVAVGDGALRFRDVLERAGATVPDDDSPLHRVSAVHHCVLALDAQPTTNGVIEPHYLRQADAELAHRA
jgi:tRNA threonylcarbamoyladenosine biosynthesis protein TsaB